MVIQNIAKTLLLCGLLSVSSLVGGVRTNLTGVVDENQTPTVSPIYEEHPLPFRIAIEQADFSLSTGLHSGAVGLHDGKWLLVGGRTNGMHGFANDPNNFPPSQQNTTVYVIDPARRTIGARSLTNFKHSKLTQHEVDLLSVTSPQWYQDGDTLYMTGGYGVDSDTGQFSTKDSLIAINIPGLIRWVLHESEHPASHFIRYISDPLFRVTGGQMAKVGKHHPTLLVFGQDFEGFYFDPTVNGDYTQQVRRFNILDDGKKLAVEKKNSLPSQPDPNYRRRDLNVVPVVRRHHDKLIGGLVALSGVFTLDGGAWTIPVEISADGRPTMANPNDPHTFKQGMNNYDSATLGLFCRDSGAMYTVLFGGISYGFFQDGQFMTDNELPFINQVTTLEIDHKGHYKQYLMKEEFPVILSTQSNPGNQLLFGAEAYFIPVDGTPLYSNGVVKLEKLLESESPVHVGYIVGGIQSTLPNTNSPSDSAASPYIFNVYVIPHNNHHHNVK